MSKQEYWTGPYGILISNDINYVAAADGGNILYKDGSQTEKGVFFSKPYGELEYKAENAIFNPNDNNWYHKNNTQDKPYKDNSTTYKSIVPDAIDKVITGVNSDGYPIIKIRVRSERIPNVGSLKIYCGDKFSSRATSNQPNSNYWIGPYGVLVPNHIKNVVADDGGNSLSIRGAQTERGVYLNKPWGEKEYKEKYATYNSTDGNWYYTKN